MKEQKYTPEQLAWCKKYLSETGFEPLMDDFEGGYETFLEAAQKSVGWFESWANDAHRRIENDIPGAEDALMASMGLAEPGSSK